MAEQPQATVVPAKELRTELLARFTVPEKSIASDESPLRIEAELVNELDRPPYVLHAYLLRPVRDEGSKDSREPTAYQKLPFGKMDVVAPLRKDALFLLFPYEDALVARKELRPGDVVLIGMEARSLSTGDDQKSERLDVDVKVHRVISW